MFVVGIIVRIALLLAFDFVQTRAVIIQQCKLPPSMLIRFHGPNDRFYEAKFLEMVRGPVFASTRWADGEWACALGKLGSDSNGGGLEQLCHTGAFSGYIPMKSEDPSGIFRWANPSCFCKSKDRFFKGVERILRKIPHEQQPRFIPYAYSDVVPFSPDTFKAFLSEIRGRCLLLGPAHKYAEFPKGFLDCIMIQIPKNNSVYAMRTSIYKEVQDQSRHLPRKGFVLIAAGLAAKVMVMDLARGTVAGGIGQKHSIIDIGSMFEWFTGCFKGKKLRRTDPKPKKLCQNYIEWMPSGFCER